MSPRTILFFSFLSLSFIAFPQNVDSLVTEYIKLSEDRKNDPQDTMASYLLFQLTLSYTEDSQIGEFSFPLKEMIEKKLPHVEKGSALEKIYQRQIAVANSDIGMYYREKGDVLKALEYFHEGLKMYETLGLVYNIGEAYNNLATVYFDVGDKGKALEFFKKSYEILKTVSPKAELLQVLANVSFLYYINNDNVSALKYYNICLAAAEEEGDKKFISECINGMGLIYFKQGLNEKSLDCFTKSLRIREEIGDEKGIATTLNNIGNYYLRIGNYGEALKYSRRSLEMSKELGSFERMRQASFGLKGIYEHLGNYKEALKMYELYIQIRDSTNNQNTRKAALEKQLEHEYEKKEIIFKQEQERLKKLYEQKQEFNFVLSLVLLVLVVIVFISFYFRYKFKKEKESKNLHIELKERLRTEMEEKERIANSIIHIQEKEREKLAAELHDGVNQLLFAGKIQLQAAKTVNEEMYHEGIKLIDTAINEIKSIAGNQGSFLLNNRSLTEALTDLVQQMRANRGTKITFKAGGFDETVLTVDQRTNILRIIQELLNNAIRHSSANNCYLSIKNKNQKVIFALSDTGQGMISGKEQSGHGIKNIHNKVALMKGRCRIFTLPNKGTKTFIEIPINNS